MKISCANMGNYTEIIKQIGDYLNWDVMIPPPTSERTIELGTKYMNELMCLPAKVTLGNFIEACDQGATDLIMFDSCGECRLKTYSILQERALRKFGYNVTVHPVRLGMFTPIDIQRIDPSISYLRACQAFIKLLRIMKNIGDTSPPPEDGAVKIGIVGEIYTILEPAVNRDLVTKLQKMGMYIHISLPLSYFVFKRFYTMGWFKRVDMDNKILNVAKRKAHEYFRKDIGGHGNESIIHTIYYGLMQFDGVIHLLPFPCMPESTVAPIIDDIGQEYHIPVMRLIIDVHTADAGMDTRLEAFADILKRKKDGKKST